MTDLDINSFEEQGFLVVRSIFSKEEILELRNAYTKMKDICLKKHLFNTVEGSLDHFLLKGDLCSYPQLRPFHYLVFEKRVTEVVKNLIGQEIYYFGESNSQSGPTAGGFHKDNRVMDRENPNGLDFKGNYPLVRVGIYLQDSDLYSGGLKVMPKSHKISTSKFKTGGVNVSARAGDLVIWKLTTSHSGHAKRIKYFKNVPFHPRFEALIPSWLDSPNTLERRAMFIVYGAKSDHLKRYLEYFQSREDYMDYLTYAGVSEEIEELASNAGVKLLRPSQNYGVKQEIFKSSFSA